MVRQDLTRGAPDWSPASYTQFRGLRLRPAVDLLAAVGPLPKGKIVDLGCGPGTAGAALSSRFSDRKIIGVDASPAMLTEAAATGAYHRCDLADAWTWEPGKPPAMIFSNAVLQWVENHTELFSRFAGMLAPGGVLAVQMPRQHGAPSHRFLREFAAEMFPDRFDFTGWKAPVAAMPEYARLLEPLGEADLWETDYLQRLDRVSSGHPVRQFTQATAMRPFLAELTTEEAHAFIERYDAALAAAYPAEADGSVLFPFRRLFFVLRVDECPR